MFTNFYEFSTVQFGKIFITYLLIVFSLKKKKTLPKDIINKFCYLFESIQIQVNSFSQKILKNHPNSPISKFSTHRPDQIETISHTQWVVAAHRAQKYSFFYLKMLHFYIPVFICPSSYISPLFPNRRRRQNTTSLLSLFFIIIIIIVYACVCTYLVRRMNDFPANNKYYTRKSS